MLLNNHSNLKGKHAIFPPSKSAWLRYDLGDIREKILNAIAAQEGTDTHDFACRCILRGQKLPRSSKTLNMYVNDAIGFRMNPEVTLYFSDYFFGTADALIFNKNVLRIFDLKTGSRPASFEQLEIYAALYCLEYSKDPSDLVIELRLYQNDEVFVENPDPSVIGDIMSVIVAINEEVDNVVGTLSDYERSFLRV